MTGFNNQFTIHLIELVKKIIRETKQEIYACKARNQAELSLILVLRMSSFTLMQSLNIILYILHVIQPLLNMFI